MATGQLVSIQWLAVGGGAALGAWVRWGLSIALNASMLPMGTLIANLGGGLLMGMAMAYFMAVPSMVAPSMATLSMTSLPQNELRLFIMTGFLGGLTTFSAFSAEVFNFLYKHQYGWAAVHITSHVIGSLLMTAIGFTTVLYLRH